MEDIEKLAERFKELIAIRDQLPYYEHEHNPRCIEIDEILIPEIIRQAKGWMSEFNKLINAKSE